MYADFLAAQTLTGALFSINSLICAEMQKIGLQRYPFDGSEDIIRQGARTLSFTQHMRVYKEK